MKKAVIIFKLILIFTSSIKLLNGQSWNIAGNAATNPSTHFVGTTDNNRLSFRTNNTVRMTLSTTGRLGIGKTTPSYAVDATGSINSDSLYRINGKTILKTSGSYNIFVGQDAGLNHTTATNLTALGYQAMYSITSGSDNTAIGRGALSSTTSGNRNTAVGTSVLGLNQTGYSNTGVGVLSLNANTVGYNNSAFGDASLVFNLSGYANTGVGVRALAYNDSGYQNIAMGVEALFNNSTGVRNAALGTNSLKINTSGSSNTAVGYNAAAGVTNNSNCTYLGSEATSSISSGLSNSTAIGYQASFGGSNEIKIGNPTVSSIGGYDNWSNFSDGRYKRDVRENIPGLQFIAKLRPVLYKLDVKAINQQQNMPYDAEANKIKEQTSFSGFIAQEVEEAAKSVNYQFSGVDAPIEGRHFYGLRYASFVPSIVKAVQEQQTEILELQKELIQYKASLNSLAERLNQLDKIDLGKNEPDQNKLRIIHVLPNPASDFLDIEIYNGTAEKKIMLRLMSLHGKEILSHTISCTGTAKERIQTLLIPSGTYILVLDDSHGNEDVSKIEIMRY